MIRRKVTLEVLALIILALKVFKQQLYFKVTMHEIKK